MRGLARFLYEFFVGEDPIVAVVVVISLGLTAAIAGRGATAWWITPVSVLAVLAVSVLRAARPDPEKADRP